MKKGDEFWIVDFIPSWVAKYTLRRYIYQGVVHNGSQEVSSWIIAMDWSFGKGDLRLFQTSDFEKPLYYFTTEKEALIAIQHRLEQELKELTKGK